MSVGLPSSIDPIQLADQDAHLSGVIPLRRMKRLLTSCRSDQGDVSVELALSHDRGRNLRVMRGEVAAEVAIICERCLEPMILSLKSHVDLRLLAPGQENPGTNPQQPDDALIVSEPVSLTELVEDELILALPMIPMHAPGHCAAAKVGVNAGTRSDALNPGQGDNEQSPFSGLAKLGQFDRE